MDMPVFDKRTAPEWLADAARFERLAKALGDNDSLSIGLLSLADDARAKATALDG
jgi:hypothetical protein